MIYQHFFVIQYKNTNTRAKSGVGAEKDMKSLERIQGENNKKNNDSQINVYMYMCNDIFFILVYV